MEKLASLSVKEHLKKTKYLEMLFFVSYDIIFVIFLKKFIYLFWEREREKGRERERERMRMNMCVHACTSGAGAERGRDVGLHLITVRS